MPVGSTCAVVFLAVVVVEVVGRKLVPVVDWCTLGFSVEVVMDCVGTDVLNAKMINVSIMVRKFKFNYCSVHF